MTPSKYQQAIYDFVKNGTGHGVVRGVAGCGKTSTNIRALNYVDPFMSSIFLAFNKHIADELKGRGVDNASTFHKLGKGNIQAAFPKAKFNQYKVFDILDDLKVNYDDKPTVARLVSLAKSNLIDGSLDSINSLIDVSSTIQVDYDRQDEIAGIAHKAFHKSVENKSKFDFDDMIYWPAVDIVPCQKFDFIFVDEAQDLNKAQITMAEKTCNGRMLIIGDPWQSIYAFRGAFIGIMDYMQHKLDAMELPLTISYRAPQSVVELVNDRFPEIVFEGWEQAEEGMIVSTVNQCMIDNIRPGDGAICRTNAPLVRPCFELIRQGIKANILGRDIGKGLISLVKRRERLKRTTDLGRLLKELYVYFDNERDKLSKIDAQGRINTLKDQIDTIVAISDGCDTIQELKVKINSTFSDKAKGVVFSSIHKAKGLEWNRIWIIKPSLMPHPMSKDLQQERNIEYVAITRTKDELYFVE